MSDLGPKFFTLEMMADALGVSKSFVSRRARNGKDVRGRPVDRWAIDEDLRPWSEEGGKKLGGFRVPRSALDEDGTPRQLEPAGRSRIRAKVEQQREGQEGGPAPEDRDGTEPSGEAAPPSQSGPRSEHGEDTPAGRANKDRQGEPEKEEPDDDHSKEDEPEKDAPQGGVSKEGEPEESSGTSQLLSIGLAMAGSEILRSVLSDR